MNTPNGRSGGWQHGAHPPRPSPTPLRHLRACPALPPREARARPGRPRARGALPGSPTHGPAAPRSGTQRAPPPGAPPDTSGPSPQARPRSPPRHRAAAGSRHRASGSSAALPVAAGSPWRGGRHKGEGRGLIKPRPQHQAPPPRPLAGPSEGWRGGDRKGGCCALRLPEGRLWEMGSATSHR